MYEDIRYEKNFLSEVIAKIDFVAPLTQLGSAIPQKLANAVSGNFPISEPTETIGAELQFSAQGIKQRQTRTKRWTFFGREREKRLSLEPSAAFISYKRYSSFENMNAEFEVLVTSLAKEFPDAKAKRFGVRYINSIGIGDSSRPTEWKDLINANLLTDVSFLSSSGDLTRLIHVAEFRFDDISVRFQFGMPNQDYPAPIRRRQFVLDIDAYVQSAHDLDESPKYMAKAHEYIQDLFERSITDQLRGHMNGGR